MIGLNLIDFCGLKLVDASKIDFAIYITSILNRKSRNIVCFSLNGQSFSLYHSSQRFKELMDQADLIHADGMSIVKASRLISGKRISERIATTDWFHNLAKLTEGTELSHYFLGGSRETIKQAVKNIEQFYPRLTIKGYHHGYFSNPNEIIELLRKENPDILWIGLGRPKQEEIALILKKETNIGFIKTCGGLFDFLSGKNKRAPLWMRDLGMEWLYRLFLEPKRLFIRYFATNIHSMFLFLKYFLKRVFESGKAKNGV